MGTQLRAALSLTHKHGSCVPHRQAEGAPQGTHQEVSDQGCQDRRLGCCQGKSQEGLKENESEPEYKKEERTVCNLMKNKQCLDCKKKKKKKKKSFFVKKKKKKKKKK